MKTRVLKRLIGLVVLAAFAAIPAGSRAQWAQTNGPSLPRVTSFAAIGSTIFAGTAGSGVFRSDDRGSNWYPLSASSSCHSVESIVSVESDLFTLADHYIFRSTDKGESWAIPDSTVSGSVLKADDHTLFLANVNAGIFYSKNLGQSWGWPGTSVGEYHALAALGQYLFIGGIWGVTVASDYTKWDSRRNSSLEKSTAGLAVFDSHVWAATANGIYISSDSGRSWVHTGANITGSALGFARSGNTIFAMTSTGIFRTTSYGASWDTCGQLPTVSALLANGTDLFAATSNGVFRSTDAGGSWVNANSGIVGGNCINIAVNDSNIFSAIGPDLFRSSDNGSSWSQTLHSDYLSIFSVTSSDSCILVYNQEHLYRQKFNSNSSWEDITYALPTYTMYAHGQPVQVTVTVAGLISVGNVIFAEAGEIGVIRTSDWGSTWTSLNLKTSLGDIGIDDTILYASASGTIYRSGDYGLNWILVSDDVPFASTVRAVGAVQGSLFVATQHGVFSSTDSGMNWISVNTGLQDSNVTFLSHSRRLFAESHTHIYFWLARASEWLPVDAGLPISFAWGRIASNDNYLFVGTSGLGVWKRPLKDLEPDLNSSSIINSLYVYPNPFPNTTKISFVTLKQGSATVKIFDPIGREVSLVFQGSLESGEHIFDWSKPMGLPNGAYECEISINGQSQYSLLIVVQ